MLAPEKTGPVAASGLRAMLLKIRGRGRWLPTTATVYSCEYTSNPANEEVGHYRITYSYSVSGSIYTGHFADYGSAYESSWKRDEPFEIRYDPRNPEKSYYPELRTDHEFRLAGALVGIAIGLVVLGIAWLSRHHG